MYGISLYGLVSLNKVDLNCLVLFVPNSCLHPLELLVHLCFGEMGEMKCMYVYSGVGMKWSVLFNSIIEELIQLRVIWLDWLMVKTTCMRSRVQKTLTSQLAVKWEKTDMSSYSAPLSSPYSHTYSCHWWLMLSSLEGRVSSTVVKRGCGIRCFLISLLECILNFQKFSVVPFPILCCSNLRF